MAPTNFNQFTTAATGNMYYATPEVVTAGSAESWPCNYCGEENTVHTETSCPRVKSVRYYQGGEIEEIHFWRYDEI